MKHFDFISEAKQAGIVNFTHAFILAYFLDILETEEVYDFLENVAEERSKASTPILLYKGKKYLIFSKHQRACYMNYIASLKADEQAYRIPEDLQEYFDYDRYVEDNSKELEDLFEKVEEIDVDQDSLYLPTYYLVCLH